MMVGHSHRPRSLRRQSESHQEGRRARASPPKIERRSPPLRETQPRVPRALESQGSVAVEFEFVFPFRPFGQLFNWDAQHWLNKSGGEPALDLSHTWTLHFHLSIGERNLFRELWQDCDAT